jgi:hypothetical protein
MAKKLYSQMSFQLTALLFYVYFFFRYAYRIDMKKAKMEDLFLGFLK